VRKTLSVIFAFVRAEFEQSERNRSSLEELARRGSKNGKNDGSYKEQFGNYSKEEGMSLAAASHGE